MARRLLLSALHDRGIPVTLKIETASDGHTASLRLIGRIQAEYLDELETHIRRHRPLLVLDLREVTLVDVAVVRFLITCEAEGIELRHCAPYIREWMGREQGRGE
jgi:anti-anti-sigma regulatory factor